MRAAPPSLPFVPLPPEPATADTAVMSAWSRALSLAPTIAWLAVPIVVTAGLRAFDPLLLASGDPPWLAAGGAAAAALACGLASAAALGRSLHRSADWLAPAIASATLAGGLAGATFGVSAVTAAMAAAASIWLIGSLATAVRGDLPRITVPRAVVAALAAAAVVSVVVGVAPRDADPLRPVLATWATVAWLTAAVARRRWQVVLGLAVAAGLLGVARDGSVDFLVAYATTAASAIALLADAVRDRIGVADAAFGPLDRARSAARAVTTGPAILAFDGQLRLRDWNGAAATLLALGDDDAGAELEGLLGVSPAELMSGAVTRSSRHAPSGLPLELGFAALEGIAVVVAVDPSGSPASREDAARLTRELRATLEELVQARRTIELQRIEIERAAATDALTGVESRDAIVRRLRVETAQAQRYDHPVAIVLIDIDGFADLNREHGLDAGDAVLREVALRLRVRTRQADALGRIGGDAFLAILPHTDQVGAMAFAEGLRRRIAHAPLPTQVGELPVRASVGVAVMRHGDALDPDLLLARGDAALAAARLAGGDTVALDPALQLPLADRPAEDRPERQTTQDSGA
jgi:diguanylate cyclase (GGDEF)-like protein